MRRSSSFISLGRGLFFCSVPKSSLKNKGDRPYSIKACALSEQSARGEIRHAESIHSFKLVWETYFCSLASCSPRFFYSIHSVCVISSPPHSTFCCGLLKTFPRSLFTPSTALEARWRVINQVYLFNSVYINYIMSVVMPHEWFIIIKI